MKNILILFSVCFLSDVTAQDVNFLATNQSLVYTNPSFAGSNGSMRNQFSHGVNRPELYRTNACTNNTFDKYLKSIKAGIALSGQSDDYWNGTVRTLGIGMTYAQHITFSGGKDKLIPSVQVFVRSLSTDYTALHVHQFKVQYRNSPFGIPEKKTYLDVNAGLLYSHADRLFLGASVFHLNSPDPNLRMIYEIPLHYSLYSSYNIVVTEKSVFQVIYKWDRQKSNTSQVGANVIFFRHVMLGAGYQTGNVLYGSAGFKGKDLTFYFGYNSAASGSAFTENIKQGGWEIHMSVDLRDKEHRNVLDTFEKM